jgi:hypothetical protein
LRLIVPGLSDHSIFVARAVWIPSIDGQHPAMVTSIEFQLMCAFLCQSSDHVRLRAVTMTTTMKLPTEMDLQEAEVLRNIATSESSAKGVVEAERRLR